jgi:hypothetical protein
VLLLALPQACFVGFFALLAVSEDSWGIFRALALLLSLPFLLLTVPALVLAKKGRALPLAIGLALLSPLVTYLAWRFA